jgi:hypothetical protein
MARTWAQSRPQSSSFTAATTYDLVLHPKQIVAKNTSATEILYGGAAGGGKSHLMRVAAIEWCCHIPNLQVYLFRRALRLSVTLCGFWPSDIPIVVVTPRTASGPTPSLGALRHSVTLCGFWPSDIPIVVVTLRTASESARPL